MLDWQDRQTFRAQRIRKLRVFIPTKAAKREDEEEVGDKKESKNRQHVEGVEWHGSPWRGGLCRFDCQSDINEGNHRSQRQEDLEPSGSESLFWPLGDQLSSAVYAPNHDLIVIQTLPDILPGELPFEHPNPFSLDLWVKLFVERIPCLIDPREDVPGVTAVRGRERGVTKIGKRLLLKRIEGIVLVGGVCGVKGGDVVDVGEVMVSGRRRSRSWPMVGIPVPCERGKAAGVYLGIMVLATVKPVRGKVVIVIRNSWSGSLRRRMGVVRTRRQ
jgi:hypothetical protein